MVRRSVFDRILKKDHSKIKKDGTATCIEKTRSNSPPKHGRSIGSCPPSSKMFVVYVVIVIILQNIVIPISCVNAFGTVHHTSSSSSSSSSRKPCGTNTSKSSSIQQRICPSNDSRLFSLGTTRQPTSISATELRAVAKSGGMMIQTESQYKEVILSPDTQRPVLVFFTAPWCGPCRLTTPVVKDILRQYTGQIDVVEVCTDDLAQVAEEAGVVSIPTIQFYYKGKALESHSIVGCVAKTVLANAVEKVLDDAEQIQ